MASQPQFKGRLIVVSGVSGAGKTTLTKMLLKETEGHKIPSLGGDQTLHFSVSCTTRPPRDGEVDGKDYFFITEEEFLHRANNDGFIEWAKVHNRYYGTPKEPIFKVLREGGTVLLDIDIQGFKHIRKLAFDDEPLPITSIFLVPPSREELIKRLKGRGHTDNLEARLTVADTEDAFGRQNYDFVVVNTTLDESFPRFRSLVFGD